MSPKQGANIFAFRHFMSPKQGANTFAFRHFHETDAMRNFSPLYDRLGSKCENRSEHMLAGLPSIADIARRAWHGRKVPKADVHFCARFSNSLPMLRP
jgi:hypothetical protein